ncbi:14288_t:CDS:1 [Acaulospora colombiana]|uniref:14288_t:CDS:1 n=1 Tax=Acaulospora colombiana TaxID=27376 RepID=A0ACA9MBF5_9GLOM|nr:14288_t:CDS:1 [Acaulospora colombiana]
MNSTEDERSSVASDITNVHEIANTDDLPVYAKSHTNFKIYYVNGSDGFQRGELGLSNSYLEGILHFGYDKNIKIKSVNLHFKGVEKVEGIEPGPRGGMRNFSCIRVLAERHEKIEFKKTERTIKNRAFRFKLHSNLSSSFNLEVNPENGDSMKAQISYTLTATVHSEKSFAIGSRADTIEVKCPLRQILSYSHTLPLMRLEGTHSPTNQPLFTYSFDIPEYLGLGTEIFIPMKIRLLKANVRILRIDISLKTYVKLSSENSERASKVEEHILTSDGFNSPTGNRNIVLQELPIFIPDNLDVTYFGTYISIQNELDIKLMIAGKGLDLHKTVPVTVTTVKRLDRVVSPSGNSLSDVQSFQDFESEQGYSRHNSLNSSDSMNDTRSYSREGNNTPHTEYTSRSNKPRSVISQISSKPGVTEAAEKQGN